MKAIIRDKYGPPDVLYLGETEKPLPKENEILVRVKATTVNRTDCAILRASPFIMRFTTGFFKPDKKIPGTDFSGIVEGVGKGVSSFLPGDKVFGFDDNGLFSLAEFLTISTEKAVLKMPDNISYVEAAASSEGLHYAFNFLNKVDLKKGNKVLVKGASGAIGSAAVQLLKYHGVQVTAVCGTENLELIKQIGADSVIDYKKEDFTRSSEKFNFIFDTVGKSSFFKCKHLLLPGGSYISSELGWMSQNVFLSLITPLLKKIFGKKTKTVKFPFPPNIKRSLIFVKKLMEEGRFKAVIDRTYPLEQTADAYRYVEKGFKTGNVVIDLGRADTPVK